jgi:protein TonB
VPPVKILDVKPVYPGDAQGAGIQGVVLLEVVIGEDGSVIDAWVVRSIPELDEAALDAVRQWQFEPTLLNGEPAQVEMVVTINFTLQ